MSGSHDELSSTISTFKILLAGASATIFQSGIQSYTWDSS
jgi:hypothetical protein